MNPQFKLLLIMFCFWLFLVYKFYKPILIGRKSYQWTKTPALVTTSSIDRNSNAYQPKIIYKYSFQGKEYINDIYTYVGDAGYITKSKAIETAQKYPEGSEIQVFVDPDDPQNSLILRGVHWVQYGAFALLTLFCISVAFIVPILNFIWPGCEPNCI